MDRFFARWCSGIRVVSEHQLVGPAHERHASLGASSLWRFSAALTGTVWCRSQRISAVSGGRRRFSSRPRKKEGNG